MLLFVLGYWLFSKLVQGLQLILVRRFGVSDQLASVVRRWVMILLAIGLIIFVLNLARIPLTVFAFMGGALAIGVGFGTQTIIKNFISGIIILFERKIRVGDIIELGGMVGHVTAVDLRATTVRGFDGVEALVPNSNFLENQVVNWTYSNHQIRRELRIGVAYGADTRATEQLLLNAAVNHQNVLKSPAPEVFFEDFADSALMMVLVFWVELGPNLVARRVDSELRHTLYRQLAEAGIAIPYPQRDVHLDLALPLPVTVVAEMKGACI
jgi:small-conductance mechanosensitive channel